MAIRKKKNNGRYQILDSLQTRHSALQAQNILHKTLQAAGLPVQHIQNLFFFGHCGSSYTLWQNTNELFSLGYTATRYNLNFGEQHPLWLCAHSKIQATFSWEASQGSRVAANIQTQDNFLYHFIPHYWDPLFNNCRITHLHWQLNEFERIWAV